MEFKDINAVDNAEAGFYFELHFHYYNEKEDKETTEETGRPVL
jgi:hypothetical protein